MDLTYYSCPVVHYERLTPPGVDKTTFHLEFEWPGPAFRAGDSVAVRPQNDAYAVERILEHIEPGSMPLDSMKQALTQTWSIGKASGKLLRYLASRQRAKHNLEELEKSLHDRDLAKHLTEMHEVEDLLIHFGATLEAEQFKEALMPLLPRFYSIASAPSANPGRIALLVAHVNYYHQRKRVGVCSDYLYRLGQEIGQDNSSKLEVALHPTKDFLLPAPERDIILIGPGTGVAPFRAYMQERLVTQASGRSWLFFGERYRNCFFYESLWQECQQKLPFKISCAFSREGAEKIYVQQRMKEHASELNQWLGEASVYVCGDAKAMAKDVEQALIDILMQERRWQQAEAKEFLKQLRAEGRYLRDVY